MTQKKKPAKKRKRAAAESLSRSLTKVTFAVLLLVALIVAVGWFAGRYFSPEAGKPGEENIAPIPEKKAPVKAKRPSDRRPPFEIYPPDEKHPETVRIPPADRPNRPPRIAIIVDDLGYDPAIAEKFLAVDTNWTFSLLPHSPYGKKIAAAAGRKGIETMLHLPMEPEEYPKIDPGPGTLRMDMSPDELISALETDLNFIPGIKGVNNHMGSKMTANSTRLYQIFSTLKKRRLYFVDSRTTAATLCLPSAKLFQIPFAQRDVFLDHVPEKDFIRKQIQVLIETARQHGEAVGIAHPHEITAEVLHDEITRIREQVDIVPVSQLVRIVGPA